MTLQQIKYIETISRTGSISKAAEELYAAQSSLSASIKEVENEYGIILFERSSKGVALTHQGREFLSDIRYISDYYENVDNKYKNVQRENERFCVSSHHHVPGEEAFMKFVASTLHRSYLFGYLEGSTNYVIDNVDSQKSDLGILFFTQSSRNMMLTELRRRDIFFNHIHYGNIHIYVHKSHPLAGEKQVVLDQITLYPFITYDNHDPDAGKFTSSFRQWNKSKQLLYVSDRATAYSLIRLGEAYSTGTGYLPAEKRYDDIVSIPITDLEKIEVGWINKINKVLSELAMEYISLLKQMYQPLASS
jgi:DNA-binding transcriptional LysR family regulator